MTTRHRCGSRADVQGSTLRFFAARDIHKDEELTINYNGVAGANTSASDTWFEAMGVVRLPIGGGGERP